MQAYNLCYSTLVTSEDASRLPPDAYEKSPSGHLFVKSTTKKGILPQILDELLAARKRAKKDMAAATDPMVFGSFNYVALQKHKHMYTYNNNLSLYRKRQCRMEGN
jgi:DNA polymerase elongation subunit (family B)